jgi:misacylated tRNA(Ala) deacylase
MKPEELQLIQDEANKLVLEGRTCHVEVQELEKAGPPQGRTEATATSGWSGKAMPADYTGGVNRLVFIDGVDRTPCCGTHLPTLNNLQVYIYPQTESVSRGTARLYFLTGPRLVHHLSTSHTWLSQAAQTLSSAPAGVPERVSSILEEKVRASKRVSELEEELAKRLAVDLSKEIAASEGKVYAKHIHRTDDGGTPLQLLTSIANGLPPSGPHLVVLSSAPTIQSAATSSVVLVFGNDEKQVKAVGDGLKNELGMKGGGKGPRWSGKGTGVLKPETLQKILDGVAGAA